MAFASICSVQVYACELDQEFTRKGVQGFGRQLAERWGTQWNEILKLTTADIPLGRMAHPSELQGTIRLDG